MKGAILVFIVAITALGANALPSNLVDKTVLKSLTPREIYNKVAFSRAATENRGPYDNSAAVAACYNKYLGQLQAVANQTEYKAQQCQDQYDNSKSENLLTLSKGRARIDADWTKAKVPLDGCQSIQDDNESVKCYAEKAERTADQINQMIPNAQDITWDYENKEAELYNVFYYCNSNVVAEGQAQSLIIWEQLDLCINNALFE